MRDNTEITGRKSVNNRAELIELLIDIKAVEIMARYGYEQDIITFKNFVLTKTIESIKKDEDTHIDMLDALIRMLREGA